MIPPLDVLPAIAGSASRDGVNYRKEGERTKYRFSELSNSAENLLERHGNINSMKDLNEKDTKKVGELQTLFDSFSRGRQREHF